MHILINKKALILFVIVCFSAIGISATHHTDEIFVNLKVLPKNISSKLLDKIMADDFQEGLGVSCSYCHAEEKNGSHKLDYASDEKPQKDTARSMMRMTLELNKKYFNNPHALGDSLLTVSCYTCHRGDAIPKD